jgi:hypothetical protein
MHDVLKIMTPHFLEEALCGDWAHRNTGSTPFRTHTPAQKADGEIALSVRTTGSYTQLRDHR